MDPRLDHIQGITRRHFLGACNAGIGAIALDALLGPAATAQEPILDGIPHFAPKAKRVIFIHLAGSPPQQDLLDYKPLLNELDGEPCPDELYEKQRFAFIKGHPKILGSPYTFTQHGSSGAWVSELLPHFKEVVDDVTIVRSMRTDQFNHAPAQLFLYTGTPLLGRPSMGSWITYGLGTENADLPGIHGPCLRQHPLGRQERMGQRLPSRSPSRRPMPHLRRSRPLPQ